MEMYKTQNNKAMKREILFKAKSVDTGEWIEGMTISIGTINRKNNVLLMKISENKWVEIDPNSLSQYINKKDKNGKKVFEGDYDEDGSFVVWCDECSSFEFGGVDLEIKEVYPACYRCNGDFCLNDYIDDFEIIGHKNNGTFLSHDKIVPVFLLKLFVKFC